MLYVTIQLEMGFEMLVTPELQALSGHISEVSVFTCVYTPDKVQSSSIPVGLLHSVS